MKLHVESNPEYQLQAVENVCDLLFDALLRTHLNHHQKTLTDASGVPFLSSFSEKNEV